MQTSDDAFAEWITELPDIEKIVLVKPQQYTEVWVIVNNVDEATRDRIYELELGMYKQFPGIAFDFHILDRSGKVLGDLIAFSEPLNVITTIERE